VIYASLRRDRQSKLFTGGPSRFYWTIGALALAVNVAGAFAYTFALEDGTASLVVPISSAYPLVTIVLAVALLHEKLTKLHYPALAAVVAGLVLIGVTL
jgi:transporter family protein